LDEARRPVAILHSSFPGIRFHSPSVMPTPPEVLSRIEAGKRAVMAQTEALHRDFGCATSNWKSDGTRVTPVDIAISEGIVSELSAQFPDDDFFSEELTQADKPIPLTKRFAWILDPIDGTNNYAMGIAHCAISLGLFENGRPVYGVIYDLARRTLMHGGPGFDLFDGDRIARVRSEEPNPQTLLGFHSPYDKRYSPHAATLVENFKIRGLGSSTLHLAYVAVGILGGTVDHNVKIWDIAAAIPLCLAGGGKVEFLNGEQFPLREFNLKMGRIFYVAGNPTVCAKLRELLKV
jgi:myo-inositol-1(or 4)-monophosphatase